jgi:hypothetical protein
VPSPSGSRRGRRRAWPSMGDGRIRIGAGWSMSTLGSRCRSMLSWCSRALLVVPPASGHDDERVGKVSGPRAASS